MPHLLNVTKILLIPYGLVDTPAYLQAGTNQENQVLSSPLMGED